MAAPLALARLGSVRIGGKQVAALFIAIAFGVAVWGFCGSLIAIGRKFMTMDNTLIFHAIGAPIGAAFFSWLYFSWFGDFSALQTALIFVATSLSLDVFVVALLIEKSFEMFRSALGVWIPQASIFAATYLMGLFAGSAGA